MTKLDSIMNPSELLEVGTQIAELVIVKLGEKPRAIKYIETGSTSSVFSISTDRSQYALRIVDPRLGKSASYESDFALRSALWDLGQPVAKPIATNQSLDIGRSESWSIEEFRLGTHPNRGDISAGVSRQIGILLRHLHNLEAFGFGKLEDNRERMRGVLETPEDGMLTRLESPWPFTPDRLEDHPAVRQQPSLAEKLLPFEGELMSFVHTSKSAIVHSDLHERQILVHNGQLIALLDFNDAVVGRPEWDFGSYLYFHGDNCLSDLLEGYTENPKDRLMLTKQAALASILIALHHGNRGVVLGRPHRVDASLRFLERRLC